MNTNSFKPSPISPNWHAELVVIGCSTGGPAAILEVLKSVHPTIAAPIVVAQHMPKGFTEQFSQRLNAACGIAVAEGADGTVLSQQTAYIAPAGYVTRVQRNTSGQFVLQVEEVNPKQWLYRPSVDELLASASTVASHRLLAVVMTGMGHDGVKGAAAVRTNGGHVITESEATAVIYGMPRSVFEAGYSDMQAPLSDIAELINRFTLHL